MSGNAKTRRRARRAQELVTEYYRVLATRPGLEAWTDTAPSGAFFGINRSPDPVRLAGLRVTGPPSSAALLRQMYPDQRLVEEMYSSFPMYGLSLAPFGPEHLTTFVSCCCDPEHDETCGLSLELALECAAWTLARKHELWIRGEEQ